jgi:hypothetical protein
MVEASYVCKIPNMADRNTEFMDEKYGFCIKCGQELPQGATFCPECGYKVGDAINYMNNGPTKKPVNLSTITILILIYAVFAILTGLFCAYIALQADVILDLMREMAPDEYQQLIDMGVTAEMMAYIYALPAIMMTISGVFAVLSGYLVDKRKNNQMAFLFCILASITSFPLIITLVVGVIIAVKIKDAEEQFTS